MEESRRSNLSIIEAVNVRSGEKRTSDLNLAKLRHLASPVPPKPGVRFYWEQRRPIFVNEKFIAFMERTLSGENTHSENLYRQADEQ
jgi:hypothetical protein